MPSFLSNGVHIAYSDTPPAGGAAGRSPLSVVLLIHGFASNATINWVQTGWVKTLADAGHRVIAFDHRGHGASEKLYRVTDYGAPLMADDAVNLLDHLGIAVADIVGYSMGARICGFLLLNHPSRIGRAIFGGLGIHMVTGMGSRGDTIAHALEARSLDEVTDPGARMFRAFAEQTQSDLKALAACMRSARTPIMADGLAAITSSVLIVVGSDDAVAGSGAELAALIPGARAIVLPGRDHMKAVGDRAFKEEAVRFLAR
jgi:pimeloyl-ACP methyl ester carboxylesterase